MENRREAIFRDLHNAITPDIVEVKITDEKVDPVTIISLVISIISNLAKIPWLGELVLSIFKLIASMLQNSTEDILKMAETFFSWVRQKIDEIFQAIKDLLKKESVKIS